MSCDGRTKFQTMLALNTLIRLVMVKFHVDDNKQFAVQKTNQLHSAESAALVQEWKSSGWLHTDHGYEYKCADDTKMAEVHALQFDITQRVITLLSLWRIINYPLPIDIMNDVSSSVQ